MTEPIFNANIFAYFPCGYATEYTIPDGIQHIAGGAFSDCKELKSVTIPNSVTSIGRNTFESCSGLIEPVYNTNCFAYFPCGYANEYTIPDGIQHIADRAFLNCNELTSVTIPNSVTDIGDYAFSACSGLTSITIPDSVTSIGEGAFKECSALTSVTIPNPRIGIGVYAFSDCNELNSTIIYNSATRYSNFSHDEKVEETYDFSAVSKGGQTLFYQITSDTEPYTANVTPHIIKILYTEDDEVIIEIPLFDNYSQGDLTIPSSVTYKGKTYSVKIHHSLNPRTSLVPLSTIHSSLSTHKTPALLSSSSSASPLRYILEPTLPTCVVEELLSFIFTPTAGVYCVKVSVPCQPLWLVSSTVAEKSESSIPASTKAGVDTTQTHRFRLMLSIACIMRVAQPYAWPTSLSITSRTTLFGSFLAPLT